MKRKLIGSAASFEELLKLTQDYFYSPSIAFAQDGTVHNSKGQIEGIYWIKKGSRYRLERETA